MSREQDRDDFPEVQAALYRVALALESFLLNGIPNGVIHRDIFGSFLEKTADDLRTALANLEQYAPQAPDTSQPRVRSLLAALRAKCQQLIDVATELASFRSQPLSEVRAAVAQIPLLRGECLRLIQDLEACFGTPKPFHQSRPAHATAMVDAFLANLERMFAEEWAAGASPAAR